MIKIRDIVDLKELEKYGFKEQGDAWVYDNEPICDREDAPSAHICISKTSRDIELVTCGDEKVYQGVSTVTANTTGPLLDVLHALILRGCVAKTYT